jgi:hypothetical protein
MHNEKALEIAPWAESGYAGNRASTRSGPAPAVGTLLGTIWRCDWRATQIIERSAIDEEYPD